LSVAQAKPCLPTTWALHKDPLDSQRLIFVLLVTFTSVPKVHNLLLQVRYPLITLFLVFREIMSDIKMNVSH
jgi:hypothetical protein